MSKWNVEQAIRNSIKFLEDIGDAVRLKNDEKLKKLCKDADDEARDLERARQEMHSHWKD
jgi:hypothetical protein